MKIYGGTDMWDYLNNASTLDFIAVSVFIAATASTVFVYLNKNIVGKVVRALVAAEANSPETALTLSELGLEKNFLVRSALKGKNGVRKLVNEVGDRIVMLPDGSSYFERDSKLDLSDARFYIREENRIRAELRYSTKGSDIFMLIISIIVYFGVAWLIVILVPVIFDLFSKVVN